MSKNIDWQNIEGAFEKTRKLKLKASEEDNTFKWFGTKMTGFWASSSNPLFNHGLPTGFSLWKTI